jgi:hypothetical protein
VLWTSAQPHACAFAALQVVGLSQQRDELSSQVAQALKKVQQVEDEDTCLRWGKRRGPR